MFTRATKTSAKIRATFNGPAGSGKTYSALTAATGLGKRIAVIDTEHGAASKYSDLFSFDQVSLEEFSLTTYISTIAAAASAGYDVLVIDSMSHAWNGKNGALEQVDRMGGSKFSNGWKSVSPIMAQLTESILSYPGHVLCTMRTKTEYVVERNEKGQSVPRKLGMAPVQRDGVEYEFDVIFDLTVEGGISVSKSRCPPLSGRVLTRDEFPAAVTALRDWLGTGAPPTEREILTQAIRGAASDEALTALIPRLQSLTETDRAALAPLYLARKSDFSEVV